jgi:hypothetical protein
MASLLWLLACASDLRSGASEPLQVRDGTFQAGVLPEDPDATSPSIFYAASVGYVVTQGQGNVRYSGLASSEAYSVAVAFPGIGSGYWVVPVDAPDPTQDDNLLFDLPVDFTRDVPYGLTELRFAAIDGDGHPGPAYSSQLCVLPDFADNNFAACDPETPPQHTILSLSWDTDVDLDLVVVTPDGTVVDAESPSTANADDDASEGVLTRDSNDGCVIDGVRIESLVFADAPPPGDYEVYARLFSACGHPSTFFELAQYARSEAADGTWSVSRADLASGALFAVNADASTLGTHLATVTLP